MLNSEFDDGQIQRVFATLQQLPVLQVQLSVRGWSDAQLQEAEMPVDVSACRSGAAGVQLHAAEPYTLAVQLRRLNRAQDLRAHAPRFGRPKDEAWVLLLGEASSNELIGLKRCAPVRGRAEHTIAFSTPPGAGIDAVLTLYVLSDCYLGLDQQYDIPMHILPPRQHRQVGAALVFSP